MPDGGMRSSVHKIAKARQQPQISNFKQKIASIEREFFL